MMATCLVRENQESKDAIKPRFSGQFDAYHRYVVERDGKLILPVDIRSKIVGYEN